MTKLLSLLLLLFVATTGFAQAPESDTTDVIVYPLWPKCKSYEKSILRLRQWLADVYTDHLLRFKREDRAMYVIQKFLVVNCSIGVCINKEGKMEILGTAPDVLCTMQRMALEKTFATAPRWEPCTRNGIPIGFKITIPFEHAADLFIEQTRPQTPAYNKHTEPSSKSYPNHRNWSF